jgi:RNA polymerase sigma factor (TIGR02999 family)
MAAAPAIVADRNDLVRRDPYDFIKPPDIRVALSWGSERRHCCGPDRPASWRTKAWALLETRVAVARRSATVTRMPEANQAIGRMNSSHDVTRLLALASAGDRSALDRVFPLVYDELRRAAQRQLRREPIGHTLNSGALVNEVYLRLVDQARAEYRDRAHFLAVAATAMRRILVDHARRVRAPQRGGDRMRLDLESIDLLSAENRPDLLVGLDEALEMLALLDARQARVIECRFFGGLTEEETAEALGVAVRTIRRDWMKARAWLFQSLSSASP